jgi:hypothetical protein
MELRRHHRTLAWLLCIAMLLAALMPALARLQATADAHISVQVRVQALGHAAGDHAAPGQHLNHLDKCPYCQLQADLPLLEMRPAPWSLAKPPAARPVLSYQSPSPLRAWAAASPRGPPRLA